MSTQVELNIWSFAMIFALAAAVLFSNFSILETLVTMQSLQFMVENYASVKT